MNECTFVRNYTINMYIVDDKHANGIQIKFYLKWLINWLINVNV